MLAGLWARAWHCWHFGCAAHAHDPPPPAPPPTLDACWSEIRDTYTETQYRYTLGEGKTLTDHRNRLYDVLWCMVRHHGCTPESIEHELRERRYDFVWLYAVEHRGIGGAAAAADAADPEVATVCRDPLTRETRPYSVAICLGPVDEAMELRAACKGTLAQCGFLEVQ